MFGKRFTTNGFDKPPQWVRDIANKLVGSLPIYWKLQPKGRSSYGCYWNWPVSKSRNCIQIYTNTNEQTERLLLVVLHEIAHHIHHCKHPESNDKHPDTFWAIALELYQQFGVAEYAARHESYASGRNYIAANL